MLVMYEATKPRGFVVVRFSCQKAGYRVVGAGRLEIGDKVVDCKLSIEKCDSTLTMINSISKKIYVGRLSESTASDDG